MLLETIKRHDSKATIKIVSIEGIRAMGRSVPPHIHSVPAMVLENKSIMYGKQVFDYLLLPGRGVLLTQSQPTEAQTPTATDPMQPTEDGPSAYTLGQSHSDSFSMIEGDTSLVDRSYAWTNIDAHKPMEVNSTLSFSEDTRNKKELPDISKIQEQRQLDLQENYLNISALPPPTFTR